MAENPGEPQAKAKAPVKIPLHLPRDMEMAPRMEEAPTTETPLTTAESPIRAVPQRDRGQSPIEETYAYRQAQFALLHRAEQDIDDFTRQIDLMEAAGIKAEIQGRPKHIYSIWNKMRAKKLEFSEVYDVRALRVLVDAGDSRGANEDAICSVALTPRARRRLSSTSTVNVVLSSSDSPGARAAR